VRIDRVGTYTTGGKVAHHPLGVTITLLLVGEHGLVGIAESEVQGLGGEVTDDVGSVTSPERDNTLIGSGALEAVGDTGVLVRKAASLKHLILVLDEELDALNGGSSGLRDGGGNTTHQEVDNEALQGLLVGCIGRTDKLAGARDASSSSAPSQESVQTINALTALSSMSL